MFKMRLTNKELVALAECYGYFILATETDDAHGDLLYNHLVDLGKRMSHVYQPQQKKFTFRLTQPEALAFYQYWNMVDTGEWPLPTVIIGRIIGEMVQQQRVQQLKLRA